MFKKIAGFGAVALAMVLTMFAAFVTHVVWAVSVLTSTTNDALEVGTIVLSVAGLFPPIGAIHGIMLWFGAGGAW
jgi:hypothetical protein